MSERIAKTKAEYRMQSKDKNKYCRYCSMYRIPNACTLVIGYIYDKGTCKFWERRLPVAERK